ncbi:MAG: ATP-binding protein [Bacteroidota bacterium]
MKPSIQVTCTKANLSAIRHFVKEQLEAMAVAEKTAHQIVLAVDEACANCMIHSHQCDNCSVIEVELYRDTSTVYVEIRDSGKAFPMNEYRPREIEDIIRRRAKGGMGIFLINRIMDKIEIEEKAQFAVYRFAKRLNGQPLPPSQGIKTA